MEETLDTGSRDAPTLRKLQSHRATAAEAEENSEDGVEEEVRSRPHLRNSATPVPMCPAPL